MVCVLVIDGVWQINPEDKLIACRAFTVTINGLYLVSRKTLPAVRAFLMK
jgi:hypothetical protein